MTKQPYFQQLLEFIGFISKNEAKTIYSKSYKDSQYTISVDFEKEEIDYPKPMILGDKSLKGASNLMATIPHSQDGLIQRALAFVIFTSIACAVAYAVQRIG